MDSTAVRLLRELLAGDPLMGQTQDFARVLTRSTSTPGGLLLVGTPTQEPWHLAAHLDDESRLAAMAQLLAFQRRRGEIINGPSRVMTLCDSARRVVVVFFG